MAQLPLTRHRPFVRARSLALVTGLLVAACGGSESETETRRAENTGIITLTPGDGVTHVSILFNDCLSPCRENVASCSASLTDGQVLIETLLEITSDNASNRVCPAICVTATGTCDLVTPASGSYMVHSGLRSARLDLPVSEPVELFGDTR